MRVNRKLYPPKTIWQAMRRERLEQVGYQCELCGLPDATEFHNPNNPHPFYRKGRPIANTCNSPIKASIKPGTAKRTG